DLVTERDRLGIAAVLAANADFQFGLHAAPALGAHSYELAHAIAIEHLKRVVPNNLSLDVVGQKTTRVVAAETKSRLREVVGTEREKLRMLRDPISYQSRARQLDHGSNEVLDCHAVFAHDLFRDFVNQFRLLPQFLADRHERHHDLEFNFLTLTLNFAGRLKDRTTLHPRDFRKQQTKTTTTKAEHRIRFANAVDLTQQRSLVIDLVEHVVHVTQRTGAFQFHLQLGQLGAQFFSIRQKLVQRRIE